MTKPSGLGERVQEILRKCCLPGRGKKKLLMTVDQKTLRYRYKGVGNNAFKGLSTLQTIPRRLTLTPCFLFFVLPFVPLYVFESGGFQPIDIPIFAILVTTLLSLKHSELDRIVSVVIMLMFYVIYVVMLNMAYYLRSDVSFYLKALLQTLYAFTLFSLFSIVFQRILASKRAIMVLYLSILFSLFTPFLIKGEYDAAKEVISLGWRNALSFNNPNQLAYFSLLIYAMAILLRSHIAQIRLSITQHNMIRMVNLCVLVMVHIFIIYSGSRAGVMAILLADMVMILQSKKKVLIGISLSVALIMFVSVTSVDIDKAISEVEIISKISDTDIEEVASKRISGRFFEGFRGDLSIVYGSGKIIPGEGKREVHNGFIDILLSYGIIGITLFYLFLLFIIIDSLASLRVKDQLFHLLTLMPIFIYNMSHNGFRCRLFWIFLAFWQIISRTDVTDGKDKSAIVSSVTI